VSLLTALALIAGAAASPGDAIADSAARYLSQKPGLSNRTCTGLTTAILMDAGYDLRGTVRDFHASTRAEGWNHYRKTPRPGDLVYFDYTYDVDRDGRADDRLSHIAVVIAVDDDGTIDMVHHGGSGIGPLRMNLKQPDVYTDASGKVLNSYLAAPGYGPKHRRLSGQLWTGFATVRGDSVAVAAAGGSESSDRSGSSGIWTSGRWGGSGSGAQVASGVSSVGAPTDAPWVVAPLPSRRGKPRWSRRTADGATWQYQGRDQLPPRRSLEGRAIRGRFLPNGMLWGTSCEDLWYLRNAVYARHGYTFVTGEAQAVFGVEPWYTADPDVSEGTVGPHLSARDQRNVERLLSAEREAGCLK